MSRFPHTEGMRVVIADDDPFSRVALARLLQIVGIAVVGTVPTGEPALAAVERSAPDVVILGLEGLGRRAPDFTRRLTVHAPASRVVVLTSSCDDAAVADAVLAGAAGGVLRDGPVDDIVAGIRAAVAGRMRIPAAVAEALLVHAAALGAGLSGRERQLLRLLAEGRSESDIALTLALDPSAVRKLGTGSVRKLQMAASLHFARARTESPGGPTCVQ